MVELAANLSVLFPDDPPVEAMARAAALGFEAVELQFPYAHDPLELADGLATHRLRCVTINAPPGDRARGERGIAALPGRGRDVRVDLERARRWALALGAPRVNVIAGARPAGARLASYLDSLRVAVDILGPEGVTVLVEPINGRDEPGYLVDTAHVALDVIEQAGPGVQLLLDTYHAAVAGDDAAAIVRDHLEVLGHVQVAGPDRHEPGEPELELLATLDRAGYAGWVAAEYVPAGDLEAGLGWARPFLSRSP